MTNYLTDFKQSSLVLLPTVNIKYLHFFGCNSSFLNITSCVCCEAESGKSEQLFVDCNEVFTWGKKVAVLSDSKFPAFKAIHAAASQFIRLGILYFDNDPYLHLNKFPLNTKITAVSAIAKKKSPGYDIAEVFHKGYFTWLKDDWSTISYDIVSGLPRFVWISINVKSLARLDLGKLKKVFKTLSDSNIICGFDIFNWEVENPAKNMELLQELGLCLLVSQGKLQLDIKEDKNLCEKPVELKKVSSRIPIV